MGVSVRWKQSQRGTEPRDWEDGGVRDEKAMERMKFKMSQASRWPRGAD